MHFLLLPVTVAALCFFFHWCRTVHSHRLEFLSFLSSSAMASVRRVSVRMRSACSVHCSTCGSICGCGLTSMTTVGFSRIGN